MILITFIEANQEGRYSHRGGHHQNPHLSARGISCTHLSNFLRTFFSTTLEINRVFSLQVKTFYKSELFQVHTPPSHIFHPENA